VADCLSYVDQAELKEIIQDHRLRGYAAQSISERLDSEFRNLCEQQYQFQKILGSLYLSEMKRMSEVFARAGEAAIVYKGGALMQNLFSDPGTRELRDIDIWAPTEKFDKAIRLFQGEGYTVKPEPTWEAGEGKLILTRTFGDLFIDFEVHQKNYSFENHPLFTLPSDARGFLVPPIEEHFLMLVIHAGYQHTFSDLKWWIDFVQFLKVHHAEMNWAKLAALCKTHQMSRLMGNVLRLMRDTESWFEYPAELFKTKQLKTFNMDFLLHPMRSRIRYYWIKHALKENLFRTALYDVLWLKSRLLPQKFKA
jgi:hypothetical protein